MPMYHCYRDDRDNGVESVEVEAANGEEAAWKADAECGHGSLYSVFWTVVPGTPEYFTVPAPDRD
jgi:hypothetical protein